ncbi:MAG TPA: GNAT family N-acetyltransferase [Actinoplanes sp.]|nr:GNAT family N-acetyltransferase [Actinoplanes sp.]
MSVVLRTGTDRDLVAVGALHYRSRAAAYAGLVPPEALTVGSPEALGAWWVERFGWERDTHRLTVAERDRTIIGFTYLGPAEEPGVTELYGIHVDPDHVGTGAGRALMRDALTHLGERAVLWVVEGNARARRFYEKGGWVADGTSREAPIGGVMIRQVRYRRLWRRERVTE